MSFVIAREISVDEVSETLKFVSSPDFQFSDQSFSLQELQEAAAELREASGNTTEAIKLVQANLAVSLMAHPDCRRW